MIEIDVLNGFRTLPKDEAKAAIQKYAEENGIAVKKQLSVENMITFVLDAADEQANTEVKIIESVDTPKSDVIGKEVITESKIPEEIKPDVTTDVAKLDLVGAIMDSTAEVIENKERVETTIPDEIKPEPIPEPVPEPEPVKSEQIEGIEYELPASFRPMQLIGLHDRYLNVPYWVLDWILKNGKEWKQRIHLYPHHDLTYLQSILFYIRVDGSVCVRESRNSGFHHLY